MNDSEIGIAEQDSGAYFGMPCRPEDAALVLVSAPWDATAPDGSSASYAPDAMIEESLRMDLYDPRSREQTGGIIGLALADDYYARKLRRVDDGCRAMIENIRSQMLGWLGRGKVAGLVGGDQSTVYGALCAVAEHGKGTGVLHIDARCRMKSRHEGFARSGASVMADALECIEGLGRLVQAGVRDFSATEHRSARESQRVSMFGGGMMDVMRFEGATWRQICDSVVAELPHEVFVDLDMSALTPDNCPHSPEAVAGGLGFSRTVYLIDRVAASGRRIAGFALTGVSPAAGGRTDAAAGARMLYRMCGIALRSQNNR